MARPRRRAARGKEAGLAPQDSDRAQQLLDSLTGHPVVAVLIVVGVILIALGRVSGALDSIRKITGSGDPTRRHWLFDGLNGRVRTLVILQLVLGLLIWPLLLYSSLTTITLPGSWLEEPVYSIVQAAIWGVGILSALIAFASWRLRFARGVIQGLLAPLATWVVLRSGFRLTFLLLGSSLFLLLPFLLAAGLYVGLAIWTVRGAPRQLPSAARPASG